MSTTVQGVSPAQLSALTFKARESLEMWADVVESQTGKKDPQTRALVDQIDTLRSAQGWSPHGFGGES